jgi:hypothetical protein
MKYEPTFETREHAAFCRAEAERRYKGKLIRDEYGMLLVRDSKGIEHTDAVLRALSSYRGTPPSMYECFVQRAGQPYVQAAFDEQQRKYEAARDDFQFGESAPLDEARQFLSDLFAETCDDWTAQKLAGIDDR